MNDTHVVAGDGSHRAYHHQYQDFMRLRDIKRVAQDDRCPLNLNTERETCGYCEQGQPRHGRDGLQIIVRELEQLAQDYPHGCSLFQLAEITAALEQLSARAATLPSPHQFSPRPRRNPRWER